MLTDSPSVRRALAALFALALIRGYNWVVMKRALAYMGPFQFAAARMLLAALVLFAVLLVPKRPWRPRALPQTRVIGLRQTCGGSALIMWARLAGGAGKVAVLSYSMPFWVMLLAWPLLGERLRDLQWLAAGAALAGLTCILEPWHLHGSLLSDVLAAWLELAEVPTTLELLGMVVIGAALVAIGAQITRCQETTAPTIALVLL